MIKLEQWMSKRVITIKEDDTALAAAKIMADKNIGSLIVSDDKKETVGILTESDMTRKIVAQERDPKDTKVADIMTRNIICSDINTTVLEVSQTMQKHHLRRMPITKKGKVVGIITSRDLIRIMSGI